MRMTKQCSAVVFGLALLAACGSPNAKARATDSVANANAGSLEGPSRRDSATTATGMATAMMPAIMSGPMIDSMKAEMRAMHGISADRMKAMLPRHRQMVAKMLSQMTQEMRSMNMPPDAEWAAVTDSLRQDLIHMPEMNANELESFMPAYQARLTRLIQMHQRMLAGTQK